MQLQYFMFEIYVLLSNLLRIAIRMCFDYSVTLFIESMALVFNPFMLLPKYVYDDIIILAFVIFVVVSIVVFDLCHPSISLGRLFLGFIMHLGLGV